MRDSLILVALAAVALAAGVAIFMLSGATPGSSTSSPSAPVSSAALVPAQMLVAGADSAVTTRANYLITSPGELTDLWQMIQATSSVPDVDFSTHSVLAVFAGQEPTAGYSIEIQKVEDAPDKRTVVVSLSEPGSNCAVAQVITTPFAIVSVPSTTLPLTHQDAVATTSCAQ